MFRRHFCSLANFQASFWQASFWRALFLLPILFCVSCTSLPFSQLADADLNLQVAATETPGVYALAGETNLPDRTQLTVMAVRYLAVENPVAGSKPNPTYSILAYQTAQIQNSKWQAELNLWQVAPDGQYQETWQLEQPQLELALQPATEVIFLATLTPADKLSRLEPQLAMRGMRLSDRTVQTTAEGQRYAQVDQAIAVALPTGKTTPPPPNPNLINYGWGDRYLMPQEPQNPYDLAFPSIRQTNAPPAADEFLR